MELDPKSLWKAFVRRVGVVLALAGTILFIYNFVTDYDQIQETALKRARAHFRDIILTWHWNSDYGGVYVEKKPGVAANTFLEFPDVHAANGKVYTLRDPDTMSREIAGLARKEGDHQFHITSLKLKNPDNYPDDWERLALESFAAGKPEAFATTRDGDATLFRYMAPMQTEKTCHTCHSDKIYKVGEVHGGISVSFDISASVAAYHRHQALTGLMLALLLGGVFFATRWFTRQLDLRLSRINRRYETLLHSTESIVWEADAASLRFTFISDQVQRLLGYRPEEWLQDGFWMERIHPEDRHQVRDALAAYSGGNKPLRLDYRLFDRQGRVVWMQDVISLSAGEDGRGLLHGVMLDISERKHSEKQTQQLWAEQNAILQNAVVGIAYVRARHIVSCNRRFEEIFGFGPNELAGASTCQLYGSDEIFESIGRRAYARLVQGKQFSEEVILRRRDGQTFWGAMTGQALHPDDPEQGAIWIYADISERRAAMEEANKLRRAVEQSPVSILITDREGRIEYVNPRFSAVTGYSRQETIGQNPKFLTSGEMPREVFEDMWSTLLAGREWRGQLRNRRKSGELFWEDVSISPMLAENGEISHFIAVKEDITLRKEAEMELEQHQAKLESLVQQRTADLRQALDAAQAADRAKNEFLANMSHEIRTPLNAVIGLSGLAMRTMTDLRQRDYMEKIAHAGQTLLAIINDLLDLSKIAAGRLELEYIPFPIASPMERVAALVTHRLAEKGLTLAVHRDPQLPPTVLGDPLRLEQILLNLVTNAIKFTPRGGIAVRFKQHSRSAGRVSLVIEVEDTGAGLSAAEIERLFQPFSQADNSITRTHGGTGLGLTICRRLCEMMDGSISVTSTPGAGSIFRVQVALGIADPASLPRPALAPEARAEGIRYRDTRVLVVDDQPINRQIVHELLKQVGITCLEAGNGREAVAAIWSHGPGHFDLVLMDVQMPEMDGRSASRAIRGLAGHDKLPIVAMTAHAMEHERLASLAAGMNDHLGKPFVTETFYQLLARWIPASRQYRECGAPATPAPAPVAAPAGLPAITGVDVEGGLHRFAGNQAAYRGWLEKFRDEGDSPVHQILLDLEAGRREPALRALHTLKGRVGMLGMTPLWQATVDLESALKAEQEADELLAAFRRQLAQTQDSLRQALPVPA